MDEAARTRSSFSRRHYPKLSASSISPTRLAGNRQGIDDEARVFSGPRGLAPGGTHPSVATLTRTPSSALSPVEKHIVLSARHLTSVKLEWLINVFQFSCFSLPINL